VIDIQIILYQWTTGKHQNVLRTIANSLPNLVFNATNFTVEYHSLDVQRSFHQKCAWPTNWGSTFLV